MLAGNDAVTFACSAEGVPTPNITWFDPSSTPLATGTDGVIIMVMERKRELVSNLTLNNTAVSAGGVYTCQADNGQGSVNEANATLIVYGKHCTRVFDHNIDDKVISNLNY